MAPTKYSTKTNEEIKDIVKNLIKAINKSTKEQSANDASEVKVEVVQVGHGFRPFGDHAEGSYIDFSVMIKDEYNVPTFKAEGLGRQDLNKVADHLRTDVKGYDVEDGDLFFTCGNFTPDMTFPTYFRKFKRPCKEYNALKSLLKRKCGMELKMADLRIGHTFTAYNPTMCNEYITLIKSYGRKDVECKVSRERYGTELSVALKTQDRYAW